MNTVDEVLALLRREVRPREAVVVDLATAAGAVLREAVRAPEDQPAFDRSAVDGFLVRSDDVSEQFRLIGEIRAGDPAPEIPSVGQAWKIATGAQVPAGNVEVVMLEDAEVSGELVRLPRRGRDHVRRRGEDARAGDVLIAEGTMLSAGAYALLAAAGCTAPRVTRPLEVLHVATGDEIVPPEVTPGPGQIRDSNSPLVAAWLMARGVMPEQKQVGEDAAALSRAIEGRRDLLLISGGASVGGRDCTAEVLAEAGFETLVRRVAVRPGKPLIVARRGDEWAFGLPGNPLSHFVCLHLFVAAALAAMRGGPAEPRRWTGLALADVTGNPRETWWPAVERRDGLRPLRWASSGDITALAEANALVKVPSSGLVAGQPAEFIRVR